MRIVFMGSPDFALPSLQALIERHQVVLAVTQPDKPAGRGKALAKPPVKVLAEQHGIPVYQPKSARAPEVAEALRATGAELAVVVAYGKILPPLVLTAFPRGCVNVHGSVLPRYRGAAPIQWAILRGETETGVTIMQLDEGMDTGDMLLVEKTAIGEHETAGELFERLSTLGAEALITALDKLERGELTPVPQDHQLATYAPMLTKEQGRIDWQRPAGEVCHHIRGVDPWPGAFVERRGARDDQQRSDEQPAERIKVFGAQVSAQDGTLGRPGEVLAIEAQTVTFACGTGAVRIAELQAPGRRRLPAADVAHGLRLSVGDTLGAS